MALTVESITSELEGEHRIIQKVVGVMAALQHDIDSHQAVDVTALRQVVEFMRVFGDELHHGKEEEILFPALEAAGVPVKGCPIGTLRMEHDKARELVARLAEATDAYVPEQPATQEAITGTLGELLELYPRHIWKEDYLAFPMSEKLLSNEVKGAIAERYQVVNDRLSQARERMELLAETLQATHEPV